MKLDYYNPTQRPSIVKGVMEQIRQKNFCAADQDLIKRLIDRAIDESINKGYSGYADTRGMAREGAFKVTADGGSSVLVERVETLAHFQGE